MELPSITLFRDPNQSGQWRDYSPLLLLGLLVFARMWLYVTAGSLWFDEAMLAASIRSTAYHNLFTILPLYDQASPLGFLLLLKPLYHFNRGDWVLRLPSLLAGVAAVFIPLFYSSLNRQERIWTSLLIAASIAGIRYSVDVKPYACELFASSVAFIGLERLLFEDLRKHGFHLIVIIFVGVIIFISAFPILYFGGIVGAVIWAEKTPDKIRRWLRPTLWYIAIGILYGAYYILYVRVAYKAQVGNYFYDYQLRGFARYLSDWPRFVYFRVLATCLDYFGLWPALLSLPFLVLGLRVGLSKRIPISAVLLGALVALLTLNLLHVFPFMPGRQMIFLLPYFAGNVAVGIASIESLSRRLAARVVSLVVYLALVSQMAFFLVRPAIEDSSESVAYLRNHSAIPVVLTFGGQPIYDWYFLDKEGDKCVIDTSLVGGFTDRCSHISRGWSGVFSAAATPWYILAVVNRYTDGGEIGDGNESEVIQVESEYIDWLTTRALGDRDCFIFNTHLSDRFVNALVRNLRRYGSVRIVVDERKRYPADGLVLQFSAYAARASRP